MVIRMEHDIAYYHAIQGLKGCENRKDANIRKAKRRIDQDWKKNWDWEAVTILDASGAQRDQDVKILKTAVRTQKKIKTRPDEILRLGEIVKWRGTVWLVRVLDPDNKIQYSGDMDQCSLLIRWELEDGSIHEEYAQAEDASKYGSGADVTDYMSVPYFTLKVRVPVNEYTMEVDRDKRFLLGQIGQGELRPFRLTRINDVVYRYFYEDGEQKGSGYLEWTMTEDYEHTGEDNHVEGIAKNTAISKEPPGNETDKGWF